MCQDNSNKIFVKMTYAQWNPVLNHFKISKLLKKYDFISLFLLLRDVSGKRL